MNTTQTLPLVSITAWSSGGTPSRSNGAYWNGTIPWISAATLKGSRIGGSDQHLTEAGLRAGSNLAPKGATLVLVRGMALHRETRIGLAQLPVSFNQDVKALVPKAGILPEFLLYALQARSSQIRELVSSAGSGTGVLNTKLLQRLPIWVPSKEAQHAVVEAMSDADDLIATLERLIAKKQAIKQGMMQQLLTGRTRLPGFADPWVELSLGEVAQFSKGMGLPKSSIRPGGHLPCIHYGELFTHYGPEIHTVTSRTDDSSLRVRSADNDVLMPTSDVTPRGLAKASALRASGVALGGDILVIRPDRSRISGPFLAHAIRRDANQVLQLVRGSTVYHLYAADMKTFRLTAPPIDEQNAIAGVLRDADAEIAALHVRLDKGRALKTGMMQQLLTGRVRLPEGAAS